MPPSTHRRGLVLEEVARCVTRLVDSRSGRESLDALAGFLQALPLAWYAVDLYADDEPRRRICSNRCSRGFAPFVTRLGFTKRKDGIYQGTFADGTLVLVKSGRAPEAAPSLICGVGLEKVSPLNDGAVLACVGAVIGQALGQAWAFDERVRLLKMLEVDRHDSAVAVVDQQGRVLTHAPHGLPFPIEPGIGSPNGTRSRAGDTSVVAVASRTFRVRTHWLRSEKPIEARYRVMVATPESAAPPALARRLQQYGLSQRESEIAELVFVGTTNHQIAAKLFISPDTVKTHCRRIFSKLGIARRTEFLRIVSADTPTVPLRRP
jgi:DNA-binding CsgD family transcriptional regulator